MTHVLTTKHVKKIGEGSFGTAFKFTSKSGTYVVKEINTKNEHAKQLADNEIRVLQHLLESCSTYFLCFVDFHVDSLSDKYSIITEYLDTYVTLDEYISNRLTQYIFVMISEELKKGVSYLHTMGVVHRDIHPKNIMISVDSKYRVRFIDYGYACIVSSDTCLRRHTRLIRYQSPTICSKETSQSLSFADWIDNDCWSLGIVILELIPKRSILYYLEPLSDLSYNQFEETYCRKLTQLMSFWTEHNNRITATSLNSFLSGVGDNVSKYISLYILPLFDGKIPMLPVGYISKFENNIFINFVAVDERVDRDYYNET